MCRQHLSWLQSCSLGKVQAAASLFHWGETYRGVVRLFNAVAKAQRARKEAEEGGAKRGAAEKLSKASFLAELRGQQQQGQGQVQQPHARLMQKPGPVRWLDLSWH